MMKDFTKQMPIDSNQGTSIPTIQRTTLSVLVLFKVFGSSFTLSLALNKYRLTTNLSQDQEEL
jgi:hypothetical protein